MKAVWMSLLMLFVTGVAFAQSEAELVARADKAFLAGRDAEARELYRQAAALGSAAAHYALPYKYNMPRQEALSHYTTAALKGHAKAMESALDLLLFHAGLIDADPAGALALYQDARKANPAMKINDDEKVGRLLKMCAESSGFDAKAFLAKYGIKLTDQVYEVWMLAEEASRGGRFGRPDPKLTFDLVLRGGFARAELESAVEDTYANWKAGVVKPFNICDYVTSGVGQSFCAARADEEDEPRRDDKLEAVKAGLKANARGLLDKAYASAQAYLDAKTEIEEGHGGTSMAGQILESRQAQLNEYLDLTARIATGYKPAPTNGLDVADRKLNAAYADLMDKLKKADTARPYWNATPENVRKVQRLWIKYRDASARLYAAMAPSIPESAWKSWLTEKRVADLAEIGKLADAL